MYGITRFVSLSLVLPRMVSSLSWFFVHESKGLARRRECNFLHSRIVEFRELVRNPSFSMFATVLKVTRVYYRVTLIIIAVPRASTLGKA